MAIGQTLMLKINAAAAVVGSKQFQAAAGRVSGSALAAGKSVSQFGLNLRMLAGGFIGLLVIRDAIRTMTDFEKTMRTVEVVTRANVSTMSAMSKVARELGASTRFTATEAGEGMTFLARAGFDAQEVMAMIPHTLNLATAAVIELGAASDMVANTIHQFNLKGRDAERVVDSLMNTANNANTDVFQLGNAMQYAGTFAGALGISLEETNAALGVMADTGIKSSMAGTALRGVFAALIKPTDKAMRAITKLGLTAADVNPAVLTLQEVFHNLHEAGQKLANTTEFASLMLQIFARRPVPGALALAELNEEIGNSVELQKKLAGQTKIAADMMDDTLFGALKQLRSAIQEAWLSLGDNGLGGAMRALVDTMTGTARIMAGMSEQVERFYVLAKILSIMIKLLITRFASLVIIKMTISLFAALVIVVRALVSSVVALNTVSMASWVGALATGIAVLLTMLWESSQAASELQRHIEDIQTSGLRAGKALIHAENVKGTTEAILSLSTAYEALKSKKESLILTLPLDEKRLFEGPGDFSKYEGRQVVDQTIKHDYSRQYDQPMRAPRQTEYTYKFKPISDEGKDLQETIVGVTDTLAEMQKAFTDLNTKSEADFKKSTDSIKVWGEATDSQYKDVASSGQSLMDFYDAMASVEVAKALGFDEDELTAFRDRVAEVHEKVRLANQALGFDNGFTELQNDATDAATKLEMKLRAQLVVVDLVGDAKRRKIALMEIEQIKQNAGEALHKDELAILLDLNEQYQTGIELTAARTAADKEAKAIADALLETRKQEALTAKQHIADMQFENAMQRRLINEGANASASIEYETRVREELAKTVNMGVLQKIMYMAVVKLLIAEELALKDALDKTVGAFESMKRAMDVQLMGTGDDADKYARQRYEDDARMAWQEQYGIMMQEQGNAEILLLLAKYDLLQKEKDLKDEMLITNEQAAQVMTAGIMDVVKGAKSMEEAFAGVIIKLIEMIIQAYIYKLIMGVLDPTGGVVSGAVAGRQGMVMSGGNMQNFATGGVVHRPTMFPMARGGIGLMGEAGAEAIMPLTRMPSGELGVKVEGSGGKNVIVNMNITTQDADSFKKSKKQIAREMGRGIKGAEM